MTFTPEQLARMLLPHADIQHLLVTRAGAALSTIGEPPEDLDPVLMLQVKHIETGISWKVALHMAPAILPSVTELLVQMAHDIGYDVTPIDDTPWKEPRE